jgi:D-alanyl-D-alanine carboxypeptidase
MRMEATRPAQAAPAAKLQGLVDAWRAKAGTPGVALAVRRGSRTTSVASGMADVERGVKLLPDMQLRAASVSKTFVAAAVLRLVEQGKVTLDEPIAKWHPKLPEASRVTVRQLLNHTSGVGDYLASDEYKIASETPHKGWGHLQPIEVASRMPRDFEPGTRHEYSNTNYHLLGAIVEQETGRALHDYLRRSILRPAGLSHVRLDDGTGPHPADARAYLPDENGVNRDVTDIHHTEGGLWRSTGWADGAVVASAAELATWTQKLFDSKDILRPKTRREMTRGAWQLPDGNGLGIFGAPPVRNGEYTALAHTGGDIGFGSLIVRFPDLDASVAIMFNGEPSSDAMQTIELARQAALAVVKQ